jgi:hypothetical protein
LYSAEARPEMLSTSSSAGCLAASMAGAPRDVAGDAGGGLVVHHAHGLDAVLLVGLQALLDQVACTPRRQPSACRAAEELGLQAQARGHLLPQRGEVAGLVHQHVVAGAQRVGQRRFPGAGAGGRIDDDRLLGLEDLLDALEHLQAQRAELGAAVVDGGQAHGPQDAVGHRRGPGICRKWRPVGW